MILIVGGAGYIGSHVNKMLYVQGYKTLVLDNLVYGHQEFVKWGEFIEGDLADVNLLEEIFSKYDIEVVMHFSAYAYVGESVGNPAKYYQNNVVNTLNLLNAMIKHNVNYFIFSSTCATYGQPEKMPITEDNIQNPINPYGKSKLMVEKILEDYNKAYGLNYCALRYFNASGADIDGEIGEWHRPETHLIPLVLDVAIGKREYISVFGTDYETKDGTCIRDYIHVNDLADAHIRALQYIQKENKSLCCNLGNGKGYSVKEIIKMARSVTGKEIKAKFEAKRAGDPAELIGSNKKAEEILGWKPKYDLKSIIETAWNWHQKVKD